MSYAQSLSGSGPSSLRGLPGYRPEIDGLRAIAVVSVIVSHAGEPFSHLVRGGFLGVDVFFVLSGFLITGILARDMIAGSFTLSGFYERRVRRILPALVVVTLASLAAAWILMTPSQMKDFSQSIVATGIFSSNIYFWLTSDYFSPDSGVLPMIHTWSLAVEEQFYLVFPLVFVLLWRRGLVLPVLVAALLVGLAVAEIMAQSAPKAAFYLLPARAWELLAGGIAGYLAVRHGLPDGESGPAFWRYLGRNRNALAWGGLVVLGVSLVFFPHGLPVPGLALVPPVAGTVILLLCARPGGRVHRGLTRPVLVGVGLVSYSAYLWHQPVFAFARLAQVDPPSPVQMAGLCFLVLGLAWASWRLVEQPFRGRAVPFGPVAWGLGGATAAMVLVGLAGHLTGGLGKWRFDPPVLEALNSASASPMRDRCHSKQPEVACAYFGGGDVSWVVFGDSHGVELAYALARMMEPLGESVLHLTKSGCPPALGYVSDMPGCNDWTEAAVTMLETSGARTPILVVYRHGAYLYGDNEGMYPALPNGPKAIASGTGAAEKRALYWQGFERMVARLRAAGHPVVLLQPVPEIARDVGFLVRRDARVRGGDGTGRTGLHLPAVPLGYYEARSGEVRRRLAEFAAGDAGIRLLDPAEVFCDVASCYAMLGDASLYFDDDHPSVAGAAAILRMLPQEVARALPPAGG